MLYIYCCCILSAFILVLLDKFDFWILCTFVFENSQFEYFIVKSKHFNIL